MTNLRNKKECELNNDDNRDSWFSIASSTLLKVSPSVGMTIFVDKFNYLTVKSSFYKAMLIVNTFASFILKYQEKKLRMLDNLQRLKRNRLSALFSTLYLPKTSQSDHLRVRI